MEFDQDMRRRMESLTHDLHETPEMEIKIWLDIKNDKNHTSLLAKGLIALANHGGGFMIFGFREDSGRYIHAPNRPTDLGVNPTDSIHSIVQRYTEPIFHCFDWEGSQGLSCHIAQAT